MAGGQLDCGQISCEQMACGQLACGQFTSGQIAGGQIAGGQVLYVIGNWFWVFRWWAIGWQEIGRLAICKQKNGWWVIGNFIDGQLGGEKMDSGHLSE